MILLWLALFCSQDSEMDRLEAALKANPKDVGALVRRAGLHHRRGRYDRALADIEAAIGVEPANAQAHFQRGIILMALQRKDDATASWDRAMALDPKLKAKVDELRSERRPSHFRPMTPEDSARTFEEVRPWLKEHEPDLLRRLEAHRTEGRLEDFARELLEATRRRQELDDLKQRDPEQYAKRCKIRDLERATFELAEKVRRGGAEASRKELGERLEELFDLREEQRQQELADLKRRVEELERILQKRRENRQAIVEKRMRELLGERSLDEW